MALPHTFGTVAGGAQVPGSFLDDNFNALGAMTIIPCTASGINAIALTPLANTTVPTAYANYQGFGFVAANTTTGAVTANFNALGAKNVYLSNGTTQASTGDIVAGVFYTVAFNTALNAGAGGFQLITPGIVSAGYPAIVSTKTGDYTILTTDRGAELRMNSASPHTFNLPSGATAGNGFNVDILNINTGVVSLTANGTDKILTLGQQFTTISLPSIGDGGRLISDGGSPAIWSWKGVRSFEGAEITINASTKTTQAHNLQVVPKYHARYLRNKTAELGYSVGDELLVGLDPTASQRGAIIVADATNMVCLQNATGTEVIINKTTPAGNVNLTTPGNWKYFMRAQVID